MRLRSFSELCGSTTQIQRAELATGRRPRADAKSFRVLLSSREETAKI